MNNKNVSVWRGDNTPPTQYHLWLKNDGKLYVNIDEQWQEIDKDSVAEITEILNQHATKLDNHQTALDDINTLHSKLWIPGRGNYSVITQGVASNRDSANKFRAGNFSLAEGLNTVAEGICSHAEGNGCQAILDGAHAEGITSRAEGFGAHAEGISTASGNYTHSEGSYTLARGINSHSEGDNTIAGGFCSHVQGIYNIDSVNAIHSVGIGDATTRKNAEYIYAKNNTNGTAIVDDPKNGYKYLIGVGGYDGISTDNTTYKSVQEVIADLTARIEQLETKVKALEDANTPA